MEKTECRFCGHKEMEKLEKCFWCRKCGTIKIFIDGEWKWWISVRMQGPSSSDGEAMKLLRDIMGDSETIMRAMFLRRFNEMEARATRPTPSPECLCEQCQLKDCETKTEPTAREIAYRKALEDIARGPLQVANFEGYVIDLAKMALTDNSAPAKEGEK